MSTKNVVLVTGGAGFLGQHVIKLLQTKADHVTEIRVLDVVPYKNNLEFEERLPVESRTGSITDYNTVNAACKDVDCVMHLASYVDTRLIPDQEFSFNINVRGTDNVIRACRENDVRRLIYCSTMDVAMGKDNIYDGDEDSSPPLAPNEHLFPVYGPTKANAEKLVLDANDSSLQTVSLRPAVLYGEQDYRYLGHQIDIARKIGYYIRLDSTSGTVLHVYVGNVAWAFICAEKALLRTDGGRVTASGHAFFIADDTPRKDMFSLTDELLKEAGAKPFPVTLPISAILGVLYILHFFLVLLRVFLKVNIPNGRASFNFLKKTYIFSYAKASNLLDYKPLYNYEKSRKATVRFLRGIIDGSLKKRV